jgi:ketopantoate reductase
MKIAIYGAGAIGAHLGAMLTRTEHEISLIARGPHLKAMQDNGLTFRSAEETFTVHPNATDDPASLGLQDYVIVTLKAHQSAGVVDLMQPLLGPETAVVTCMNGVPWWYFHGLGGEHDGRTLETVDPGAKQWRDLGPERAIGCIVYPAAEIVEPGVCQHIEGNAYKVPLEKRLAGATNVGAHKTSMLQDLERGRPMEIDALVTAVAELGDIVGVETPMLDAVLALVQLRGKSAGLYPTS